MNNNEIWVDIASFDGKYSISNFGRIKSNYRLWKNQTGESRKIYKGKILTPTKNTGGYLNICLFDGIKRRIFRIHTLVAMHFLNRRDDLTEINHIDGNKLNNHFLNLQWCTRKENMAHAWGISLMENARLVGIKHHKAKITEREVLAIRNLVLDFKNNKLKYALANEYNINICTINDILKRRSWTHI